MVSSLKVSTKQILISCEHGGNHVPSGYRNLFLKNSSVLNSHRGWDAGALVLARELSRELNVPLVASETTRLLVDLNRSPHHHNLFSEFTGHCDPATKKKILREFYFPYRGKIERKIKNLLKAGNPVIHLSIHSFTPRFNNNIRNADIGLLYDPPRKNERVFCKKLQSLLKNSSHKLNVRRNYPYRGNADGFTTYLRKQFSPSKYIGIEIEINQKHISNDKKWKFMRNHLVSSITQITNQVN